ncbi:hypothetical protein R1sor_026785 [Riccia sorocarpa]|uniref:Cation/H+ exchanger transmembrane domain-containing protein n=1 Tax=Riccia sorocarpa TaxID=122646 RepID=A0ABD3GFA7_9MARC
MVVMHTVMEHRRNRSGSYTGKRRVGGGGGSMGWISRFFLVVGILGVLFLDHCIAQEGLDHFDFNFSEGKLADKNETNGETPKEGKDQRSIAEAFERVLDKEFPDKDPQEGTEGEVGSSFNSSVADKEAVLETVARVTHDKPKKNETEDEHDKPKPFQLGDLINLEESGSEELPTLIDKKDNVFVMSNPRSGYMVLQQDLRFISDLVVVIVSAAVGGIIFAALGQPVISGYLLAGSAIGPGGFSFVSELVQVETLAQFGVVFMLFGLGLEFSMAKLRAVRSVAIVGGLMQILLFMGLCGLTAVFCGAKLSEGVFVGAFLSMSSTAVVLKFFGDKATVGALHGQITIGTLVLQDCAVGLLFALLPVLGGENGVLQGILSMTRELIVLGVFISVSGLLSRSLVPQFFKLMIKVSVQTGELFQLGAVAFCLLVAWCSDKAGLSLELGAFVAGVMISSTDYAQHTLEQVEPIRNLFSALFLASIGMLINVQFLWSHMDILLASLILVITAKTVVVTSVVRGFGYNMKTALFVGMALAQIGEFAFVLLSRASNLHLVQNKLYLLLLGTTALSLVTTPLLFKAIPVIMQLGAVMHWFPSDGEAGKGETRQANSEREPLWSAQSGKNGMTNGQHGAAQHINVQQFLPL